MATSDIVSYAAAVASSDITFLKKFQETFQGKFPGPESLFCDVVPASSKNVEIPFLVNTNTWREWKGQKQIGAIKAYKQSISFRKFENTFGLDRSDVEYDPTGNVGRIIAQHIDAAAANFSKIIFDEHVSASGAGPTGYDGVALYHTAHPMADGSTQGNKTTSALSFSTYDAAFQSMTSLIGHDGQPLNIVPNLLVCGPKLRKTAMDIAGGNVRPVAVNSSNAYADPGGTLTPVAATNVQNVFQGEITVAINERLVGAYDDYWYLMCTTKADKPMLMVQQRGPTPIPATQMDGSIRFLADKFLYSIEADVSPAAGLWVTSYAGIL